ncbi:MAG: ribbon-helix-helix domain-containing protein [Verrucomicrobiota bacterium]
MSSRPLRSRQPVPGDEVERISLTISATDKAALDSIANEKRVSLAWVVRDAVTQYLERTAKDSPSSKKRGM